MMKHEWIAEGGSVYSTQEKIKCSKEFRLGKNYKYRDAVMFNVGNEVAKHVVELHNAWLKQKI